MIRLCLLTLCALALLPPAVRAEAASGSDAAFTGALAGFFSAPVPESVPSAAEESSRIALQRAARIGDTLYFIDGGRVFSVDRKTGAADYLYKKRAQSLLVFQGTVVALDSSGDVSLWSAERRQWTSIGGSAARLAAAARALFCVDKKGALRVFEGGHGGLTIAFFPMFISDGNGGSTLILIPMAGGRRLEFDDTGVRGVADIASAGSDLEVRFQDGSRALFSQLRPARK